MKNKIIEIKVIVKNKTLSVLSIEKMSIDSFESKIKIRRQKLIYYIDIIVSSNNEKEIFGKKIESDHTKEFYFYVKKFTFATKSDDFRISIEIDLM